MSEQATFRQLIIAKAREADLPFGQRVKLRIVLRLKPDELAKEIFEQAKAEGILPVSCNIDDIASVSVGAPDWRAFFESFGDFIVKVLPLILQILPLFL